jgi:hypothetical protein
LKTRRPKRRAFILAISLLLLSILMIMALALATQGSEAVLLNSRLQRDTKLQAAAQGALSLLGDGLNGWDAGRTQPPAKDLTFRTPGGELGFSTRFGTTARFRSPQIGGGNVLDNSVEDLRLSQGPSVAGCVVPPWHSVAELEADSGERYLAVHSAAFPYAAFAEHGDLTLDSADAWSNPTNEEIKKDASLGPYPAPVVVRAHDDIVVQNAPAYGKLLSDAGTVTVRTAAPNSAAVALSGFPKSDYASKLVNQVQSAYAQLAGTGLDKTDYFNGEVLSAEGIVKLMRGDESVLSIVSLRQSTEFRFPILPGLKEYGLWTTLLFHVPFTPDGATYDASGEQEMKDLVEEVQRLQDRLTELDQGIAACNAEIQRLNAAIEQLTAEASGASDDRKAEIQTEITADKGLLKTQAEKLRKLTADRTDVQGRIEGLRDKIKEEAQQRQNAATDWTRGVLPQTLSEEKELAEKIKEGWKWSYVPLLRDMGTLLWDLVTGKLGKVVDDAIPPIRVVHLDETKPYFEWKNDLTEVGHTFTVPRGRSVKLRGNWEFKADVYVQKGASLHITQNLTISDPGIGLNRGRLILDEGATLLVDGNLKVEGTQHYGSVLVCSPYDKTQGITAAILCKQDVKIAHDILPAISLDEIVEFFAKTSSWGEPLRKFLTTLLDDVAPNLAKFFGPFHTRICCIAPYATTFEFINLPLLDFIPFPIPMPIDNVMVPAFKGITLIYQVFLNFSVGENLYLYSPWWILPHGLSPVVPKLEMTQYENSIKDWVVQDLPKELEEVVKTLFEKLVKDIIEIIVQDVLKAVIEAINPFQIPVEDADNKVDFLEDLLDALKESAKMVLDQSMHRFVEGLFRDLQRELVDHATFYEAPGVLIYAGEDIEIGEAAQGTEGRPNFAAGLLLAEGTIEVFADRFLGCIVSRDGNIVAQHLQYNPYFTRASLYVPQTFSTFYEEALQFSVPNTHKAIEIGVDERWVTAQGWQKP